MLHVDDIIVSQIAMAAHFLDMNLSHTVANSIDGGNNCLLLMVVDIK